MERKDFIPTAYLLLYAGVIIISFMGYEARMRELGLELSSPAKPLGAYVPAVRSGDLLFLSGVLPMLGGELKYRGKLGRDLTIDEGYQAARVAVLNALANAKGELGSLDKVDRVVKMIGYVASSEGFDAQPKVVNGASELLVEIFGDNGRHARVAVGVNELPLNSPIELELILRIKR